MSEYTAGKLCVGRCENDIAIVSDCNDSTFHKGEGYVMAIMDKHNDPKYNQEANAAEIVRRWNAHEDLAHELEEAGKIIEQLYQSPTEKVAPDLRTAERKAALAQAVEE